MLTAQQFALFPWSTRGLGVTKTQIFTTGSPTTTITGWILVCNARSTTCRSYEGNYNEYRVNSLPQKEFEHYKTKANESSVVANDVSLDLVCAVGRWGSCCSWQSPCLDSPLGGLAEDIREGRWGGGFKKKARFWRCLAAKTEAVDYHYKARESDTSVGVRRLPSLSLFTQSGKPQLSVSACELKK